MTDGGIKHLTNFLSLRLSVNNTITQDDLENMTNLTHLQLEENDAMTPSLFSH